MQTGEGLKPQHDAANIAMGLHEGLAAAPGMLSSHTSMVPWPVARSMWGPCGPSCTGVRCQPAGLTTGFCGLRTTGRLQGGLLGTSDTPLPATRLLGMVAGSPTRGVGPHLKCLSW